MYCCISNHTRKFMRRLVSLIKDFLTSSNVSEVDRSEIPLLRGLKRKYVIELLRTFLKIRQLSLKFATDHVNTRNLFSLQSPMDLVFVTAFAKTLLIPFPQLIFTKTLIDHDGKSPSKVIQEYLFK
jgi:hypothetical protein